MRTVLFLIAALVAVGFAGIATVILNIEQVDARSCQQDFANCHGCSPFGQGAVSSGGKCVHID